MKNKSKPKRPDATFSEVKITMENKVYGALVAVGLSNNKITNDKIKDIFHLPTGIISCIRQAYLDQLDYSEATATHIVNEYHCKLNKRQEL